MVSTALSIFRQVNRDTPSFGTDMEEHSGFPPADGRAADFTTEAPPSLTEGVSNAAAPDHGS